MGDFSKKRLQAGTKVSVVTLAGNFLLGVFKLVAGVLGGSTAMVADGIHSFADILSTVVVIVSLRIAVKPADQEHPYGHGRAEAIAAKLLAVMLVITGLGLAWEGLQEVFRADIQVPGQIALWAALLSLLVKEAMFRYTNRVGLKIKSNLLIADAWHHRSDALSSLAALVGILGSRSGFPMMDPLAAVIVAGMIGRMGFIMAARAIGELMDTVPDNEVKEGMIKEVLACKGVKGIGELRIRTNGPDLFVDLEIVVKGAITTLEAHEVSVTAKERIMAKNKRVKDVLVHIEPEEILEGR